MRFPLLATASLLAVLAIAPALAAPPLHRLPGFPHAMQQNSYSCGVGAVQAVLAWYDPVGLWTYQEDLAQELGTTEQDGTSPEAMVRVLKSKGLKAELKEGMTLRDLERWVEAQVPVIIDYEAYGAPGVNYTRDWADGHYSVVVGYDASRLYLMDPSQMPGVATYLTRAELLERWHDRDLRAGKPHDYVRSGIVVQGQRKRPKGPVHVD